MQVTYENLRPEDITPELRKAFEQATPQRERQEQVTKHVNNIALAILKRRQS